MVKTNTFDAGLERVDPVTHTARDASHFRRMVAARKAVEAADAELLTAVQEARADGDSWTTIAVALGVSRRAAQQRFGGKASVQATRKPSNYALPSAMLKKRAQGSADA